MSAGNDGITRRHGRDAHDSHALPRRITGFTTTLIGLVVAVGMQPANAEHPSVTITGFPDNGNLVKTKVCDDGEFPWTEDCSWTLTFKATVQADDGIKEVTGKVDNIPKVVTNTPALAACDGGNPTTLTEATFSHDFAVKCPDGGAGGGGVTPKTFTIKFATKDCKKNKPKDMKTLELRCYDCEATQEETATESNGDTTVQESPADQDVMIEFVVLNISQNLNEIALESLGLPPGWIMNPSIPPFITLGPGESEEFFVDVTVPGGTPAGAFAAIELQAEIPGVPDSGSNAFATIFVEAAAPDMPASSPWGLFVIVVLILASSFIVLRRTA